MDGQATISPEVLGSYAADAAREVSGVQGIVEGGLHRHRGARVAEQDGDVSVELHLSLERGVNVEDVGRAVQERVAGYLSRMAGVTPSAVDVVIAEVGPPPGG
jgi:uncharacterized alkaline shock family protein YloU